MVEFDSEKVQFSSVCEIATSLLEIPVNVEGIEIGSCIIVVLLSVLTRCYRGNVRSGESSHCGGRSSDRQCCGLSLLFWVMTLFLFLVKSSKLCLAKCRGGFWCDDLLPMSRG